METKKGIESTKPTQRPKTANEPLWSASRRIVDDDPLDELALDDTPPTSNLKRFDNHQRSNDEILERKRSLFGNGTNQQSSGALPSAPKHALPTTNSRNHGLISSGNDDFSAQRPFTANTIQPQFMGTNMSGQGS